MRHDVGHARLSLQHSIADYEVDFVTFFTKLTSVGATFNPDMYLKPLAINPIRF